ncbi:hypothetical protein [Paenibacillus illinoisensis]|uniref:hypothetical protein n=1 Tax=Paenibacillus illinoisensis TaxID=59845 RepID=UPI0036F2AE64
MCTRECKLACPSPSSIQAALHIATKSAARQASEQFRSLTIADLRINYIPLNMEMEAKGVN